MTYIPARILPVELAKGWELFAAGKYNEIHLPDPDIDSPTAAEQLLLTGMVEFRLGNHQAARRTWNQATVFSARSSACLESGG